MSECHFWWKAGEVQWCDMTGQCCDCEGWEEHCDMRAKKRKGEKARLVAQTHALSMEDEYEDY